MRESEKERVRDRRGLQKREIERSRGREKDDEHLPRSRRSCYNEKERQK